MHHPRALADDLKAIRDHQPISAKGLPSWVVASRFLKRHQRQVHAVAMTAIGTVVMLIAIAILWQQSEQATLGQLRIDTPAGLYVANIQRYDKPGHDKDESRAGLIYSEAPDLRVVTTPMQNPITLPSGSYRIRLDGAGDQSQIASIVVKPRELTEIEYIDRRQSKAEVDIYQKLSTSMPNDSLGVLGKEAFEVFDPEAGNKPRFALSIADLDAGLVETTTETKKASTSEDDPPLTFAFHADQTFQGDYSVANSPFARIERISTALIDLNRDSQNDFLITAARHAAIAAVSSDGRVLWKRRLPMSFEIAQARSGVPKQGMPNEAIVDVIPVDDLDDDGTTDLVINAALFDPSGFSRPFLFTLSGRDGKDISIAPLSTINMGKVRTWPWSGLLRHRRQFNSEDRSVRSIFTHFENISLRSQTNDLANDSWSGTNAYSALYVLPQPILVQHNNDRVAITATDQAIHFINLADGTFVSPDVKLTQPILRGPQQVRLANGELGFLVLTGVTGTAWTKCSLELCVLGESQLDGRFHKISKPVTSQRAQLIVRFHW